MPTVSVSSQATVERLITAVKQLSPAELREFMRQFAEWREQNGKQTSEETTLLRRIQENSSLPAAEQRRFNRLRRKRQAETLSKTEEEELQALWRRVEQMNVARLEAVIQLARRRGGEVKTLMRELGLAERPDVF
jgi:hypothetical protein